MEANPPGIEKSNLISWGSSDDHLQNSSTHVKSYTCAFCKRGFSNAQALGGHMNIHRRDRAKLRQFADQNLLSLDITKTNPIEPPDASEQKMNENMSQSSEEKSCTPKRPDTLPREDHNTEVLQQLPFFAETPSATGDIKASSSSSSSCKEKEEKRNQFRHSHSSKVELDLELRLGPEPDHDQTSAAITKAFF